MSEKESRNCRWSDFRKSFKQNGLGVELLEDTPQYLHFLANDKPVWVFREDNRQTLARIADEGLKIHHFVGIRDGCMEGGNHECVNERPYLSHLLPLAADGMQYTTDHMSPLQLTWERKRKFRSGSWWDFRLSEPSRKHQCMLTDDALVPDDVRFELQSVLVKVGDKLNQLRFGAHPTSLDVMRPFRSMYGTGILAEYRLHLTTPELDGVDMSFWVIRHTT